MASRFIYPTIGLTLVSCAAPPRIDDFERTLALQDSATAALGQWCMAHRIADPATIRARPVPGPAPAPSKEHYVRLGIGMDEPLGYRHVQLTCGDTVLSEAHNWFVPSRLTAAMNEELAASDTPFGKVIAPLGFVRERLASRRGPSNFCTDPATVLSQMALLRLPDGRPVSLVAECYTAANLGLRR